MKNGRRTVIKTLAGVGASFFLQPQKFFAAEGEKKTDAQWEPAFSESLVVRPLPFQPGKLKGISERLIQSHWENNYSGAVKSLNVMHKKLSEALVNPDLPPYLYAEMKREHLLRTGSVVLHETYFGNLGGDGKVSGAIASAIQSTFGSYEKWESEFKKTGAGLGGGSGWVILGYNLHLRRLENYWSWDHMHNSPATLPILAMDMYEHAYQIDYGAAAPKYIDAFFQNIQWEAVNERLVAARKIKWV